MAPCLTISSATRSAARPLPMPPGSKPVVGPNVTVWVLAQSSYLTTFELTMTGANADTVVTPEVVAMNDANKQVRNVTTLS